jgi:hypothetical protein
VGSKTTSCCSDPSMRRARRAVRSSTTTRTRTGAQTFIAGVPGGFLMVWEGRGDRGSTLQRCDAASPPASRSPRAQPTGLAVNPPARSPRWSARRTGRRAPGAPSRFFHPNGSYVGDDVLLGYGLSSNEACRSRATAAATSSCSGAIGCTCADST